MGNKFTYDEPEQRPAKSAIVVTELHMTRLHARAPADIDISVGIGEGHHDPSQPEELFLDSSDLISFTPGDVQAVFVEAGVDWEKFRDALLKRAAFRKGKLGNLG